MFNFLNYFNINVFINLKKIYYFIILNKINAIKFIVFYEISNLFYEIQ
jgi:hypothetical protein